MKKLKNNVIYAPQGYEIPLTIPGTMVGSMGGCVGADDEGAVLNLFADLFQIPNDKVPTELKEHTHKERVELLLANGFELIKENVLLPHRKHHDFLETIKPKLREHLLGESQKLKSVSKNGKKGVDYVTFLGTMIAVITEIMFDSGYNRGYADAQREQMN